MKVSMFIRNCPICNRETSYTRKARYDIANIEKRIIKNLF